jgi:hypothetical protein
VLKKNNRQLQRQGSLLPKQASPLQRRLQVRRLLPWGFNKYRLRLRQLPCRKSITTRRRLDLRVKSQTTPISSLPTNPIPKFVAAFAVLCHVAVSVTHGGPVAVPDVPAYLSVSQWLYGGVLPSDLVFHPGYGFLLGPVGFLSGDSLHSAALLMNALLAGVVVVLAATLCRDLGGPRGLQNVVAVVAALQPSVSAASRVGWPETLLVVCLLLIALLLEKEQWVMAGAIAGLAISFHPRVMVVLVALALTAVSRRQTLAAMKGIAIGCVPAFAMIVGTGSWPSARLEAAQNLGDGVNPVATTVGQWLVLGAGTGGLAVLAIASACSVRQVHASALVIVSSALLMLFLGGWVLAGSARIDTLMYSRYIGPWAIPLTVIGLVAVYKKTFNWWHISLTLALTIAAFWLVLLERHEVTQKPRTIMTLDLGALWKLADQRLVTVGVLALVIVTIGAVGSKYSVSVPLFALLLVAVPSTLLNHRHLHSVGQIADGQVTSARLVPASVSCLSHDESVKSYAIWLYRLQLPQIEHRRVDLSKGQRPCEPYVISDLSLLENCIGTAVVHKEPRAKWGLFMYPAEGCR